MEGMMSLDMKCRGLIALALNCWIHKLTRQVSRYGQVGECMLKPAGLEEKSLHKPVSGSYGAFSR